MFYSITIVDTALALNNGRFVEQDPLIQAMYNLHLDIICTEIDTWRELDGSDDDFLYYFQDVFPAGFLRRDIQRAKNILFDLHDIAVSPVLRRELTPINTYVMCKLIERWFDAWAGDENMIRVPKGLKENLRKRGLANDEISYIVRWFTNGYACSDDFAETYNADYVNGRFAEEMAYFYLRDGDSSAALQFMGVTIDEFFDLLPNDLREQCIRRYEREKVMMGNTVHSAQKCMDKPTIFISYSWDGENHKYWVGKLADRLREHGIKVILDQNDLMLGDPLTQFMEQSIACSDYVLIICTPQYKMKADARKGGVGYEESIITSDVLMTQNHRKYITVLAEGTWETAVPIWAGGKYGVDLLDRSLSGDEFEKLVESLKRSR